MNWPLLLAAFRHLAESPHVAGFLGSVIAIFLLDECTPSARVFSFLSGVAAWLYGAPILAKWMGMQTDAGPAFIAGLSALFGAKAVKRAFDTFDAVDWEALVGRVLPMKKDRTK